MLHHPVLDHLAAAGVKLGLERVRDFLTFLGEPHRAFPIVHIGGTNGKGSVCAFVSHALIEAGYQVGTNLSPHLEEVNERFRLNMFPVDDATLIEAIEALDRARDDWNLGERFEGTALTYFEFTTALAFSIFAAQKVDVGVIEVGMGGRLDATNVVQPVVTAITSVQMDHMAELGDTLAAIAAEKAGIMKKGAPMVIGAMPNEPREVIEKRAKALGVDLWRPGRDLMRENRKGAWNLRTPEGLLEGVQLGLEGEHQGGNALVALGVLHALRRSGLPISDDAIRAGFAVTRLGGRLEQLKPGLLVDGAHNVGGAEALAKYLASKPRPRSRILLWGMGRERDPMSIIAPLLPHVDEVVTTRCAHPKAMPSRDLAIALEDADALLADGGRIEEALPEVYREADETVVAGSLYLVGAVKSLVRQGVLDGILPGEGSDEDAEDEDGEE